MALFFNHSVQLMILVLLVAAVTITSAKDCAPGWGAESGKCQACQAGSYSTIVKGKRVCQLCPVAFYSDAPKATACTQCPPGLWTGFPGTNSRGGCYPCYPLDPIPQVPLPDGKGSLTCQRCPPGAYASPDGSRCLKCAGGGRFVLHYKACTTCPPGTRYNGRTSVAKTAQACEPCAFNTYQDQGGQPSCKACPAGTYVLKTGQKSSAACKPYLAGQRLAFTQAINSVIREDTYKPRRSSYLEHKAAAPVSVVATSGTPLSCDLPTAKRLVAVDGGKLAAASLEGRRTQCKAVTVYLLPGNRYSVAVQFRVPFKADRWAAFSGKVAASLKLRLSFREASKGLRTYVLDEDVRWTGVHAA